MLFQESDSVELKESYVDDIWKEIIAFANTNGGTLYVGVRDNGEVLGLINPDQTSLKISNSCRDAIKPDITMFLSYKVLEIDSKNVLEVQIHRGTSRPYYLGAKGLKPTGVYVRQGSSSAPASDEAIRRMIKETDGDEFETMRSMNQDLTFVEVRNAFSERGIEFKEPQMMTLGLINSENLFTNLALLLSDQCPHIIKAATFHGSTQNEFQDRKEFTGSLLKQLNDAYSYLEMRNQTTAAFNGLLRIDSRDYSEVALREALLNAIVHRDYSNLAGTIISVYSDRIEFISYGGLAGGVTLKDVLYGLSVCRNRRLADVFYRLKLIEAYGTGLQKIRNAYAGKNGEPEFMDGPNSFKVVLPNMNLLEGSHSNSELDADTEKVLRFIEEKGEVTRSDIQAILEISTSGAIRLMKKLRDSGLVTAIGKGKNIKYTIA